MDQGVCYTYKAAAFPRYRFFQQHLQRMSDRWQQILDAGSLPDCLSQGRVRLKDILSKARQIEDTVTVNVFAYHDYMETGELLLQCDQKVSPQVGTVSWDDFIEGSMKRSETMVTVIVLRSKEEKVSDLQKQFSGWSEQELRRVIIYFVGTKSSVPYTDVIKTKMLKVGEEVDTSEPKVDDLALNKQIQYLLEESVILVLNCIADYNKELVPKKQCYGDSDMLVSAIYSTLMKSMRNPFVVKDLSPDGNNEDEEVRKATDDELSRLSSVIGSNWELLGPPLGLTTTQLDHIKVEHKTQTQQCYQMFITWRQKEGSSLSYLLQLLENFSHVISMDMKVVKEIEQQIVSAKEKGSEKDKLFHKKLLDFVSKKTRYVVCDKLSMKYGISANIINELLNEGFYGYEKKVEEQMNTMDLPEWPRDKSDDGVMTCRMFSYNCATHMTKMIRETEEYIKVKHQVLVILRRLQFQLFGLLHETNVPYDTKVPGIPKLPLDLQHDIQQVSDVYGCGTIWGELVIHVTKDINQYKRAEIEILLSKYMYWNGYTTELIDTECENAGGYSDIEHGHGIRAKDRNTSEYNYGSLGCFVHIKSRKDDASRVASANNSLYGLTCAHCVEECKSEVEINYNGVYEGFGTKHHHILEPNIFDVATIEIDKLKTSRCSKDLKNSNQASIKSWRFQEHPSVKTPVYKYGAKTGLTYGTCISIDYQKKIIEQWNEKLESNKKLYSCNNILISREDIQENVHQIHGLKNQSAAETKEEQEKMDIERRVTKFSEKGDSGSVVCKDGPENEKCIHVLSMLTGIVEQKNGDIYSFSNHIHKTVDELEKRFDCVIQPACDSCSEDRL